MPLLPYLDFVKQFPDELSVIKHYISIRGIRHIYITHKIAYSKEGINTNRMESFWATIYRMLVGTYHHVSRKLLQSYIDECVFRYNQRKDRMLFKYNTFDKFMTQTILI